jgi:hypothetical protein
MRMSFVQVQHFHVAPESRAIREAEFGLTLSAISLATDIYEIASSFNRCQQGLALIENNLCAERPITNETACGKLPSVCSRFVANPSITER